METAVSYLTILLNDLEQIKNSLSGYNNLILFNIADYLDPTQTNNQDENLWRKLSTKQSAEDKAQLRQTIGYFRAYSTRAYIGYKSIEPKLSTSDKKLNTNKEIIESTYTKIKTQAMPSYGTAEAFVQALNDILVNEINIESLINTTQKVNELSRLSASPTLQ